MVNNMLFPLLCSAVLLLSSVGAMESTCDCQPTEGYLVTRLWDIVGESNLTDQDVIDEFNTGFAPLVTHMAGFQRYIAATTGNSSTVFFMNQFDTAEHAKAAQEGAKDFVKNGILDGAITPNQFTEDQLVFHFDSSDCVTSDSTGSYLAQRLYKLSDENTTPESMYQEGLNMYNQTLQNIDGFVAYSGALSSPGYEQLFVYNIWETEEDAVEAVAAVRAYAAANPNPNPNERIVSSSGFIQFDYLCAAGNASKETAPSSSAVIHGIANDAVILVLGTISMVWSISW